MLRIQKEHTSLSDKAMNKLALHGRAQLISFVIWVIEVREPEPTPPCWCGYGLARVYEPAKEGR